MPGRHCLRKIEGAPGITYFKPAGTPMRMLEEISLTLDEFEAVRLADLEGLCAEAAAEGVEPGGQGRGHGPIIPPPGAFASPRGQRGRPRRPVVSSRRVYLRGMLIAAV